MNEEELQKIIDQLESTNVRDEAYFGIFQYGGGPSESFIKANKKGLELFAINMLKASIDSESVILDNEKTNISFDHEDWIDGDTFISYIEPIAEKREAIKEDIYQESWQDKATQYGCFVALILIVITLLIGLTSIVNWLF